MPDITFGPLGKAIFPTKYHGDVTLSQGKWNTICNAPERSYYPLNGEKIATTLILPDTVRHHKREIYQFLYYKQFSHILIQPGIGVAPANGVYFAVVIDSSSKRICTVFPVNNPKPGEEFKTA